METCDQNIKDRIASSLQKTLPALWALEIKNYNIRDNYQDLLQTLDLGTTDPEGVSRFLDEIRSEVERILREDKPPREPEIHDMFSDGLCPVPNNPATKTLIRALFLGNQDMSLWPTGWNLRGGKPIFETRDASGGTIKISLTNPDGEVPTVRPFEQQIETVKSFTSFTADVLMAVLCQICHNFCENKTDTPHCQTTLISSSLLLRYKNIQSRGEKTWTIRENIAREMEKLRLLRISMKNVANPLNKKQKSPDIDCEALNIRVRQRRFNIRTFRYIPTAWEVTPGKWIQPWMATDSVQFIGNLHKSLLQLDHRDQRGADTMAKKLGYAFFTVPGGTYYLKNGVDMRISKYLETIGEYTDQESREKYTMGRKLNTFEKALEKLVALGVCELEPDTSPLEREKTRGSVCKTMDKPIKLTPNNALKIDTD
jgi:hypothetical protein